MNRVVALVISLLAKSKEDKQNVNVKNRGDGKSVSLGNTKEWSVVSVEEDVIIIVTLLAVGQCKAVCIVDIFEFYMHSTHVLV